MKSGVIDGGGFTGAGGGAASASDAAVLHAEQVSAEADELRIMAPLAAQRAALEKDGRSDAETVFRGESLDTSDVSCDMSVIYVHFLPCVPYCSRRLNMVRRAVDQVVLALFIKFGKVGHISGNTHDEASVILGVLSLIHI